MINELDTAEPTVMSQEEVDVQVMNIVSTLGQSYRDFILSSKTYNLAFFKDEPLIFTQTLAKGLVNHYPMWPNPFWNKLIQPE